MKKYYICQFNAQLEVWQSTHKDVYRRFGWRKGEHVHSITAYGNPNGFKIIKEIDLINV